MMVQTVQVHVIVRLDSGVQPARIPALVVVSLVMRTQVFVMSVLQTVMAWLVTVFVTAKMVRCVMMARMAQVCACASMASLA